MKIFEQSFGKQENFQKTAQFFNPLNGIKIDNIQKRRRENSLPQQNFEAIKSILSKTKIFQQNGLYRKTTIHSINDCKQDKLQSHQSTKQSTKLSTQQSTQESQDFSNNIPKILDLNIKNKTTSFSIQNQKTNFNFRQPIISEYNSQINQQMENNIRLSKVSKSLERRKYKIQVKNPFLEAQQQTKQTTRKFSSKSFFNQKAQINIVNRIFSSRSESLQK